MSLVRVNENGGRPALLLNRSIQVVNVFCLTISICALVVMVGIVSAEVVLRAFFSTSTYIADEYSGYMLVTLTMMALASCQLNDKFPRVEVLIDMVPERAGRIIWIVFDLVSVGLASLLVWKLTEFQMASLRSGDLAPTLSATPLWIPKGALVVGSVTYLIAVCQLLIVHLVQYGSADAQPAE